MKRNDAVVVCGESEQYRYWRPICDGVMSQVVKYPAHRKPQLVVFETHRLRVVVAREGLPALPRWTSEFIEQPGRD